jgi:hypothetical protein
VISRARGLQGLRQRWSHSARRSYAARHVQAMLLPDTSHAFLHAQQPADSVIFWITRRVRLTLPLTFRTGLPCTRQHQDRCSSQLLQICSCVRGRPRRDPKTSSCDHLWLRRGAVVMGNLRHTSWQRASHIMAACFTRHGQRASQRVLAFVQAVLGEELREQVRDGDVVHIGEGDVRVALEAGVRQHQHRGPSAILVDRLDE